MTGQHYGSRVEINFRRLTRACERQLLNNDPVEDYRFEAMFSTMETFLKQLRETAVVDESLSDLALASYKEKISALRDLAAMRTAQPVITQPTTPVSITRNTEPTRIPNQSPIIDSALEIGFDNVRQTTTKQAPIILTEPTIQPMQAAPASSAYSTLAELASIERDQLFQDSSNSTSQGSLRRRGGGAVDSKKKNKSDKTSSSNSSSAREAVDQVEEEENKPVLEDVGNLVSELKHNASALQQEVRSADTYFEQMDASVNLNRATMSKENDTMKTMIKESSMSWWFYILTTLIVIVLFMALLIFIRTAPNLSGQYSS